MGATLKVALGYFPAFVKNSGTHLSRTCILNRETLLPWGAKIGWRGGIRYYNDLWPSNVQPYPST